MNEKRMLAVDDWPAGREIAIGCNDFSEDVEEEWLAEESISCYNCRYRRFMDKGIQCMKSLFPEMM